MAKILIRNMTMEDVAAVLQIEHQCFSIPWTEESFRTELAKNKLARYVVAEVEGQVVGYGGMWIIVDEAHVTNIAVHPEVRGKGYGNKIVAAMIDMAKKEGVLRMTLEVRKSNEVAQTLYKRWGFTSCGIRPRYYEDNQEDAIIMWREEDKIKN
ncbi:ribosomal protein S18-alanine N-acetyltransferase [Clostridiaceae bacterium 35-E11]